MAGYHSPQVAAKVRLNTNEAPEPPPAAFVAELQAALAGIEWHRYPDRSATALRQAIAEAHGTDAARVFAANGSNEVLQTLLLAYGGPGRRALVFEPTYALHGHIARLTATEVVEAERGEDFTLDPEAVTAAIAEAQPAVTFLCSPNNPTGMLEPAEVVAAAVAAAPGLVVVDEAYGQFAPRSHVADVTDAGRLVVVRTFSKTWSMAAVRLGYCIAPAPVVETLQKVCLPYHLDAVKQVAGRLALRHEEAMRARVAALVEERGRLAAALAELPVATWPSHANFILFRPLGRDGHEVWRALLERSVLVRDCSGWPRLAGCLRVTVGTAEENDAFLAALKEVLA
jgi:histidinol-phosphate aminotransferase